mgnify:CR=1 FL=1
MNTSAQRLLICAAFFTLAACTTVDLARDRSSLENAKSCCASTLDLPRPMPVASEYDIQFGRDTPHFNFGEGVVPFARITIDPSKVKIVALHSFPPSAVIAIDGGGTTHYVGAGIEFFSPEGKSLGVASLSPPVMKTYGFSGWYTYLRYAEVPTGAASATIFASRSDIGKTGSIQGHVSGGGLMVGSVFVPMPGGTQTRLYTLVPYGRIVVVPLDSSLR